jgi:hypothetical protein
MSYSGLKELNILLVWVEGKPIKNYTDIVEKTLDQAITSILCPPFKKFKIIGDVNKGEKGPLPISIGYTEDQDHVDANAADAKNIISARDFYLKASDLVDNPPYILFVVPPDKISGANAFSIRFGYCSVVPVPTGKDGTADAHTYAHEIGHGLGLKHTDDTDNLMYPYRKEGNKLSGNSLTNDQISTMATFLNKTPSLCGEAALLKFG